jgi:hypothetical protein
MMGRPSVPAPAAVSVPAPAAVVVSVPANSFHAGDVPAPRVQPSDPVNPSGPPKWTRTRQSAWATDGSRTIGFELAAENDVRVWMTRVRPVLSVRCLGRQVEAFVITDSAMSIESSPDQHTVHVSFDGESQREERWVDSASKHELFAPDGAELAGQLARARTMRFGFTPYGAPHAVADFDVHGFAESLDSVTRTCGTASKANRSAARTSVMDNRAGARTESVSR